MKKITPILAKKQPLLWRQAIQQAEHRGYSFRNTILKPIIDKRFSFKNYSTYLFDHLIIGSNPIITHLLLLKIHDHIEYINRLHNTNKQYKIGIILNNEQDYWAYHAFEKEDIWITLKNQFNIDYGNNFNDLIKTRNNLFNDEFLQNCIFIDDSNFDISHMRYDDYVKGYILHLGHKSTTEHTHNFQSNMPTVLQGIHNINQNYYQSLLEHYMFLSKNGSHITNLSFPNEKNKCQDNNEETHILLSHHVWLTSQPQKWLFYNVNPNANFIDQEDQNNIYSSSQFNYGIENINLFSFGSAKHIAHDFYGLEKQALYDLIQVLSLDIKSLIKN